MSIRGSAHISRYLEIISIFVFEHELEIVATG